MKTKYLNTPAGMLAIVPDDLADRERAIRRVRVRMASDITLLKIVQCSHSFSVFAADSSRAARTHGMRSARRYSHTTLPFEARAVQSRAARVLRQMALKAGMRPDDRADTWLSKLPSPAGKLARLAWSKTSVTPARVLPLP